MAKKDHDPCDFHRSLIVQFPDDRISKLLGNLVEPVFRFQYIGFDKEKMSWNIHIVIFEVTNPRIVLEYNFTKGNNMEQLETMEYYILQTQDILNSVYKNKEQTNKLAQVYMDGNYRNIKIIASGSSGNGLGVLNMLWKNI